MNVKRCPNPEDLDVYEVAKFHSEQSKENEYPSKPVKPVRDNYPTHSAFGREMDAWEVEMQIYRSQLAMYMEISGRIYDAFMLDLLECLGIMNHPKAGKLYEIAWDEGHSGGLTDVAIYAERLSELLKGD